MLSTEQPSCAQIIRSTEHWVESVVIGLNLCPFAKRELMNNRVRFVISEANDEVALTTALENELNRLSDDSGIETTLLIHPNVLQDFYQYNQYLDTADQLLREMRLEGVYQIASFHPQYQFAGTAPDDAENYTNRAPYPILHLLREASVEQAIASYPEIDEVPERNIALLEAKGAETLKALLNHTLSKPK